MQWNLDQAKMRYAASAALAALAAIGAFATVASILGGGWQGVLLATAITATVFFVALRLLTKKGSATPEAEPIGSLDVLGPPADSDTQITSVDLDFPMDFSGTETVTSSATNLRGLLRTSGRICDVGPYDVDGGEMKWIELDVRKDERIKGRLVEVDGNDFDWFIVDEKNLVRVNRGDEFTAARQGEGVTARTVRWKALKEGLWFLILDMYGRSNSRRIEVDLRRY